MTCGLILNFPLSLLFSTIFSFSSTFWKLSSTLSADFYKFCNYTVIAKGLFPFSECLSNSPFFFHRSISPYLLAALIIVLWIFIMSLTLFLLFFFFSCSCQGLYLTHFNLASNHCGSCLLLFIPNDEELHIRGFSCMGMANSLILRRYLDLSCLIYSVWGRPTFPEHNLWSP